MGGHAPGTSYTYTVRAAATIVPGGSTSVSHSGIYSTVVGWSPYAAPTVTPTTSLKKPTLTAVGTGSAVRLDWTINNAGDATGWEYRKAEIGNKLTPFPGNAEVDLSWESPSDTTNIAKWQYRSKSSGDWTGVSWTDVPSSGATTTSYTVGSLTNATEYDFQVRAVSSSDALVAGTLRGDASATPWTSVSGAATRTATVSSLTASTNYAFVVRAVNDTGKGQASDIATNYAAARPAKPTGLAATTGEEKKVTLTWPTTNTAAKWQYSKDDGSTWTNVTPSTVGTNHSYEVTGLTNGTEYTFRVRGINAYDELGPQSDEAKATPRLPAPTGLTAAPGDTIVAFTWDNPSDSTITHYEYRRSTTADCTGGNFVWSNVPSSGPGTTSFTMRQLANGVQFYFCLRAASAGDHKSPPHSIETASGNQPPAHRQAWPRRSAKAASPSVGRTPTTTQSPIGSTALRRAT